MIILEVLSYLLIVLTFLPLIKDNYWLFRTLEYPRFQKFIIVIILLCSWLGYYLISGQLDPVSLSLLAIAAIYLAVKMLPYTIFSKKEVLTVKNTDEKNSIKLFTANVYQYNTDHTQLLTQIKSMDPDVILLLETDRAWASSLSVLEKDYPEKLVEPRDNTYGLVFYSRLKLEDAKVVYLVKNDIPSIDVKVHLLSGQKVQLYGLHPEPPVPGESLRSTAKDKELMKVAFKASECELPCIVLGDLNDVAWSYTTSLFTKISELLDVRCGRGFYSTFSAKSYFMRFPLDYIFCSEHFGLCQMKRMPYNGSDHFPIYTHLLYRKDLEAKQEKKGEAAGRAVKDAAAMASKSV